MSLHNNHNDLQIEIVPSEPIPHHRFKKGPNRQHKDFVGMGHRQGGLRGWNAREFIAWDGEGTAVDEPQYMGEGIWIDSNENPVFNYVPKPQPYVLLGHSKDNRITRESGLSTGECFEFILNTKLLYPKSIFIGFAFNYDINQMLRNAPMSQLERLAETGRTRIGDYKIEWLPGKKFRISHVNQDTQLRRGAIIYDVFGFFQSSFLEACANYLPSDDPDLGLIQRGKAARDAFTWGELDDFIIPYNKAELRMLVQMMNILREDFHEIDVIPDEWYGPGAVANKVFQIHNVPISRDIPKEVLRASQYAYAGGRFEQFRLGRYESAVYESDINSAYPKAATELPDLSQGSWEHVGRFEPESFGVWHIDYVDELPGWERRPQPLFCRSKNGDISYPSVVRGWYWSPEANLVPDFVTEGYVFRPTTDAQPFSFVERMYEQRNLLQVQKKSSERALKITLASLYGKTAQTVGHRDGEPPRWHQLEYAGYITSYARAQLYRAMMQKPHSIIAVETDAIFSTEPLDLDYGKGLGQWKQKTYDEICYIQSGLYYAVANGEVVPRYRGMDFDRKTQQPLGLPYRKVLDILARCPGRMDRPVPSLHTHTKRFVGLGMGLRTQSVWRSWEVHAKVLRLDTKPEHGKRYHLREECQWCKEGITLAEAAHPMLIGGESGETTARPLPWNPVAEPEQEAGSLSLHEWLELGHELERYQ